MENIKILENIAADLELLDITVELNLIKNRLEEKNKEIIVPIVGEFSSGKTTLLNSLMDSKKLETASKPTTSVVYEIYFGQEKEYAEVIFENGESQVIEDISDLKNDDFQNVSLVKIYDTSKQVPDSTVLVDTPGLSSNDPKHLEALSNYLPNADALILCVDANQQITNSLLEFIKFNNLAHLPLYLAITKADTKTSSEMDDIKQYILKNIAISPDKIISIASTKNDLNELHSLLQNIQENKNKIVNNVLDFRLNKINNYLKGYISNLMENATSDKSIEKEVKEQQRTLERLSFSINRLIQDTKSEIEEIEYNTARDFNRIVSDKLDGIISKNSPTLDQEAIGAINSTSNLIMNNCQIEIRKKLYVLANERKNTELGIPLRSLESVDTEEMTISPLSYDIDLASAGQQQIKNISNGIKIAATVAAVVATAGLASAAAPAAGATSTAAASTAGASGAMSGAATGAMTGAVTGSAKTAGTVMRLSKVAKTGVLMKTVKGGIKNYNKNMAGVEQYNIEIGQMVAPAKNQGFVEKIVGKVGDSVLGKPQRRKMINEYMESSLIPEFKNKLNNLTDYLLQDIQKNLNNEAKFTIDQLENKLKELKELSTKENQLFKEKIENYKQHLILLNQ